MPSEYSGPYAERMKLLERVLNGFDGKRVLELGCGRGETTTALQKAGAIVRCIDIKSRHVSPGHVTASTTEILAHFAGERFDAVIAFALFGSPLAQWCVANKTDLRVTELDVLKQVLDALKPGGILLFYNADVWSACSRLDARDFKGAPFLQSPWNDTIIAKKSVI